MTGPVGSPAPGDEAWDRFVGGDPLATYLQTSAWARVKVPNGWRSRRVVAGGQAAAGDGPGPPAGGSGWTGRGGSWAVGGQVLLQRPRLVPWTFAYAPRGPLVGGWSGEAIGLWTDALRATAWGERIAHVRMDPEVEADGPADPDGTLRAALVAAGWRRAPAVQPTVTRVVDLRTDEASIWSGLRKKWRQYVNKARAGGTRVVDVGEAGLPAFHSLMTETATRAGTRIRAASAYRDVWDAFAPSGAARLLFAVGSDGAPEAALFLLRCGDRVVEPYGGMTAAGAESRANYLVKWEAIRTSREAGAVSYDMWGLVHPGIRQFKAGFGGREIGLIGAWDLPLDRLGATTYQLAEQVRGRSRGRPKPAPAADRAPAQTADPTSAPAADPVLAPTTDPEQVPTGEFRLVTMAIREASADELHDWDRWTVHPVGGSVYQSLAWGAHRERLGWAARHLVFDDGFRLLSLERAWPVVGGAGAYLSRGPIGGDEPVERTADRLATAADWLFQHGVDVVSSDPEIEASTGYGRLVEERGFGAIDESQPSRHRMRLTLPAGVDETVVFGGFSSTLRQLIRAAEKVPLEVVRLDAAGDDGSDRKGPADAAAESDPPDGAAATFDRLYDLLAAAAERRHFHLGSRAGFVDWSVAALAAGYLVYFEVRDPDGAMLGGATFYRHGRRLTYSHSGDRVEVRRTYPGVVRLILWRAIQLAIAEGLDEVDLAGVDVPGARRVPEPDEPMYGLYAFKRSFGAEWVELAGNHERVARPARYLVGRVAGRLVGLGRRP